jgi:hypothetical protein
MQTEYEIVVMPNASEIVILNEDTVIDVNALASIEVVGIAEQGPPGPKGSDGVPVIPDFIDLGNFV